MLEISKKEIAEFRSHGKKILKLLQMKENPAYHWFKYRNLITQAFNYAVVLFCKVLPPLEIKNQLYRLIGAKIGKTVSIANDVIFATEIVLPAQAIVTMAT